MRNMYDVRCELFKEWNATCAKMSDLDGYIQNDLSEIPTESIINMRGDLSKRYEKINRELYSLKEEIDSLFLYTLEERGK